MTSESDDFGMKPAKIGRRKRIYAHISPYSKKLHIAMHSIFPTILFCFLIYQQFLVSKSSPCEVCAGYWVGAVGILLQLIMWIWGVFGSGTYIPLDYLLLIVAICQAASSIIGGSVTLAYDKTQIFIGAVSLTSVVFSLLPMYLTITRHKFGIGPKSDEHNDDGEGEFTEKESSFYASRDARVKIKRINKSSPNVMKAMEYDSNDNMYMDRF